jgi:serine/threonine protein kinase
LKDYLVDPVKGSTKALAEQISWKRGSRIGKTRCALLTALDIAEALKFMHKSTTLHGDLKPHNILLVTDRSVRFLFSACAPCWSGQLTARRGRTVMHESVA